MDLGKISTKGGSLVDSLVQRIQLAAQTLKRSIETEFQQTSHWGITGPQLYLLNYISRHEKCNLTQLAEVLLVKPSAITVMLDRLEKPGYVKRVHCSSDRRVVLVETTPEGKQVLESAGHERNQVISEHISRLEHHEVVLLAELLEKMISNQKQTHEQK